MEALLLGMQKPSDFLLTSFVIVISLTALFIEQFHHFTTKKKVYGKCFIILGGDYYALRKKKMFLVGIREI
jgi:hypothetical protein